MMGLVPHKRSGDHSICPERTVRKRLSARPRGTSTGNCTVVDIGPRISGLQTMKNNVVLFKLSPWHLAAATYDDSGHTASVPQTRHYPKPEKHMMQWK